MTKEEWQKEIEGLTPEQKKELAYGILLLLNPLKKHLEPSLLSFQNCFKTFMRMQKSTNPPFAVSKSGKQTIIWKLP